MKVEIIKTKSQYKKTLRRFEEIFLAKSNSLEGKEADLVALVLKDYEEKYFKIDAPDPVEAIKYRMEHHSLTKRELGIILGSPSRVSDILSRKRKLTLEMIRKLHSALHIPLKSLVKEY